MKKVVRDGKVAVLYSPGYGAGWYSWNLEVPACVTSPEIVALVESDRREEITDRFCKKLFDLKHFCPLGAPSLCIEWLPEQTQFRIDEYDGFESVVTRDDDTWFIA